MAKKYFYNGDYHTITALEKLSGLSRSTLTDRLNNGWDVEHAVETPRYSDSVSVLPPEMYNAGNIDICFTDYIPGVFESMQPTLNKIYSAEPHCPGNKKQKSKLYYIITLDNGMPLIVYPNEFVWFGSTASAA